MSVSSVKFAHLARLAPELAEAAKQELGAEPAVVDRDLLERIRARVSGTAALAVLDRLVSQLGVASGPTIAAQVAATRVLAEPQTPATAPSVAALMTLAADDPPAPSYAELTRKLEEMTAMLQAATKAPPPAPAMTKTPSTLASMLEAAAMTAAPPVASAPVSEAAKAPPTPIQGVIVSCAATDSERLAEARKPGRPIGLVRPERSFLLQETLHQALARIGSKDTIFVDRVNELTRSDQVKLAHFMGQRQYRPLGDHRMHRFDGQIALGFSVDLEAVRDRLAPELQAAIGIARRATGSRGDVRLVVNVSSREASVEGHRVAGGKRLMSMNAGVISAKSVSVDPPSGNDERFHNGDGLLLENVDQLPFDDQPKLAQLLRTCWIGLGMQRGHVEGPIVLTMSAHPDRLAEVNALHPDLMAALRDLGLSS